jgi:hypothetical protein
VTFWWSLCVKAVVGGTSGGFFPRVPETDAIIVDTLVAESGSL